MAGKSTISCPADRIRMPTSSFFMGTATTRKRPGTMPWALVFMSTNQAAEEPYDAKVSRTVLQPGGSGDRPAEVNNYSRAILASARSRRQDLSAFFTVFYAALREYGSPKLLVSDGGGI